MKCSSLYGHHTALFCPQFSWLALHHLLHQVRGLMHAAGPKNPLHGITLEKMLVQLQAHYGWAELGDLIRVNCFNFNPSVKSSLAFLRRTPWAREKVEWLYLDTMHEWQPKAEAQAAPAVLAEPRADSEGSELMVDS